MLLRGSLLLLVHLVPLLASHLHNQDAGEDSGRDGEVGGGADHWGVTDHNADILEESNQVDVGSERDGRKYYIPKGFRPQFYNFNQPYSNPRVIRPPVKFVSNGQPYNIVVNPREYITSPPPSTTTTPSTATASKTDSPLIWLTNTFLFNGRPTNVFSLPHNPWRSWPPVQGIPIHG